MKKFFFIGIFSFLVLSCGNTKQIQEFVNTGNYDSAIDLSIEKISKKKGKKSADPYILLLKEAYNKAMQRDKEVIARAQKDVNPEKWQTIYDTYLQMDSRQNKVKALVPLRLTKTGENISFAFENLDTKIIDAKNHLVAHLYKKAKILLNSGNKKDIRRAYDLLDEIDRIDSGYKDVSKLMDMAHQRGMTYAVVEIENKTDRIIPQKLQDEILNFGSYGASNFWVDYHHKKVNGLNYDYLIQLQFTQINISPDQEREKEILEEREIQDGYTYQKDSKGNIVKDSLGKPIKIPKIIKVKSRVFFHQQYKEATMLGEVKIVDLKTGQQVDNFPLNSKYVFDYKYANYQGDRRAIRKEYQDFLDKKPVPFPSNAQMIYDAAKDIKMQLKNILSKANFL